MGDTDVFILFKRFDDQREIVFYGIWKEYVWKDQKNIFVSPIALFVNHCCIIEALGFGKKVTRVKHHCVHYVYRQKEKSKEKES